MMKFLIIINFALSAINVAIAVKNPNNWFNWVAAGFSFSAGLFLAIMNIN